MATIGLLLMAGCASNGDFGEIKPSLVRDDIHDWVGSTATPTPSRFPLTDDERQLRDLAYPLLEQPFNRQKWNSIAGEYGAFGADGRGYDRGAYASYLLSSRYRSPASRYAQLIDDVRNDTTRLAQFFETAARVLDIDGKRHKAFAFVSSMDDDERSNAVNRMRENVTVLKRVQASLARRLASYRFALERLVIMTPTSQAVEAELAINQFQFAVAHYRNGAPTGRSRGATSLGK